MTKLYHCDACGDYINDEYNEYYMVTVKAGDGAMEKYVLCDDCYENMKQRIRNGEMTEVY